MIEFLAGRPAGLRIGQAVCALHGPEAATELAMLALLRSPELRRLPLLPALLQPGGTAEGRLLLSCHWHMAFCQRAGIVALVKVGHVFAVLSMHPAPRFCRALFWPGSAV